MNLSLSVTPLFQSTLPVGGATLFTTSIFRSILISIHAPRGGSDKSQYSDHSTLVGFQSTLPVGGATV